MNLKSCPPYPLGKIKRSAVDQPFPAMKLLFISLLLFCLSNATASVYAQQITLHLKDTPIEKAFEEIQKQSGYTFLYKDTEIANIKVTVNIERASLGSAVEQCLATQNLSYEIVGKTVVIKKKSQSKTKQSTSLSTTEIDVKGAVTDSNGKPLPGVIIRVKGTNKTTATQTDGTYEIKDVSENATLIISMIGYQTEEIPVSDVADSYLKVSLKISVSALNQVTIVSTGYQDIPKERATGSFVQLNNAIINRRVSTNILDRIDGISSGVLFNGNNDKTINTSGYSSRNSGINVRGQSTLYASTNPLIVLDNFPYEGEINNINPNDIESITILKDAAAASIWGASSGNGVIVITTKKGKLNQKAKVDFNTSVTIGNKPNLKYDRNFLNSSDYIDIETLLFNQGYFDGTLSDTYAYPAISPAVQILANQKNGGISQQQAKSQLDALRQLDVRDDFNKYIYQKSINQQYSLGIRGGSSNMTYALSVGRDDNRDNLIRNGYRRTTVNIQNTYTPVKSLIITGGVNYSQNTTLLNNAFAYGDPSAFDMGNGQYSSIYPYAQLASSNGTALALPKNYSNAYINSIQSNGLLDWSYKPLDEIKNSDNTTTVNDLLLRVAANYKILPQLSFETQYQNERQVIGTRNYQSPDTYYTRNLINQFADFSSGSTVFNFPLGGILNLGNYNWASQNFRTQFNFNQTISKGTFSAIAGAEIRERKTDGFLRTSYGFDPNLGSSATYLNYNTAYNTNPSGFNYIPAPPGNVTGVLYRYVSYFANAAYTYDERYVISVSGRKDGANIFGVKPNDKVTPLWSTGFGWNLSKAHFYKMEWLPYLKIRATYGFNGNVYFGSAYLTGSTTQSSVTGINAIAINTPPNPNLRWEKVKNINVGIDFGTRNNRITGTLEFYNKNGQDLIEPDPLAPQTGFSKYMANAASTKTNGLDLTLQSRNLTGKFQWNTTFLFSILHDKVTHFDVIQTSGSVQTNGGVPGIQNKPLYSIFSYKWAGLDPTNGDPRGYLNGKVSKDYNGIINNYNPDSLIYNGSARPTVYGSLRNDFSYNRFALSINVVYKLGYVFRASSVTPNYSDVLYYFANSDYTKRWQKPGDEGRTNVPSFVYPSDKLRSTFYTYSQTLVESGDHVRLQDIRLSYDLSGRWVKKAGMERLQIFGYANNIGILWRKNKNDIDPDNYGYGISHTLPVPFSISFGVNANF